MPVSEAKLAFTVKLPYSLIQHVHLYATATGLSLSEVTARRFEPLWLRGGFPRSFTARGDAASLEWRTAFIRTFLERDIPQLGLIAATRGMLGAGIGLLLSNRLAPGTRKAVGATLMAVGIITTIPLVLQVVGGIKRTAEGKAGRADLANELAREEGLLSASAA